ncbi:unnamed protein product [Somion occarium]|uniref:NF-kappa-B-activating protein C-terminal domain-containing protein n=1 Tax=Somion occarium TaxID=3059160 RepID=A0ABP1DFV7_9APHY
MATIHPSRMGLVPQNPKDTYSSSAYPRGRSPSPRQPRKRTTSRSRSRERRYAGEGRVEQSGNRDSGYGDRSRRQERARADDYFDESRGRKRSRSRSLDKERDKERVERRDDRRGRRPSPEYTEYKRPSSKEREGSAPASWRQQDSMYSGRRDRPQAYPQGGSDFLDSRRQQREKSTFSIWPPSPKAPTRSSPSPDSKRRKKSRKHKRDVSSETSTDSEEERRHRERKERKRARKEKEREREKDRERRRHKSRSRSVRAHGESEDERRERRHRRSRTREESEERSRSRHRISPRSKTRTKSPEQKPPSSEEVDEDEWVEKPATSNIFAAASSHANGISSMGPPPVPALASSLKMPDDEESDEEVGPKPLKEVTTSKKIDERQYGGALLRGEGSAMAAFLVDGTDVRIPRRGEIGLSSDEIASYEQVGYVMSGSRHRRMNAVRMRKENQVISAEEKRGILKLQQEERERREAILREEFQQLVEERLKGSGSSKPSS